MKNADFKGNQTIGHFLKSIMEKMADEDATCAELEMEVGGCLVSFSIEITAIETIATPAPQDTNGADNHG